MNRTLSDAHHYSELRNLLTERTAVRDRFRKAGRAVDRAHMTLMRITGSFSITKPHRRCTITQHSDQMTSRLSCPYCDQLIHDLRTAEQDYQARAVATANTSLSELQRAYEAAQQLWRKYRRHVATHATEQVGRANAAGT